MHDFYGSRNTRGRGFETLLAFVAPMVLVLTGSAARFWSIRHMTPEGGMVVTIVFSSLILVWLAVAGYRAVGLRASREALEESEQRYRATFDAAGVGIAHVGLDGQWLRINDAVCSITGYTREELHSLTFSDITHPDDVESDWEQARRVAAGEIASYTLEKRYIRKDGALIWINLTVSQIRDSSGAPRHYVSVIEDITERKRAENELRTAKEQLQLIADNMAVAVTRCSRDLRYIWVSYSYAAMLHMTPQELAGRPFIEIIGSEAWENIRSYVERVLAGEKVEYTTELHYRNVGVRSVRAAYVPTYGDDGMVDGWIAALTDVTEEKRSAERLRQSQRLESLGILAGGIAHDFNNLLVGVLGNASLALDVLGTATPARPMLQDLVTAAERAAGLTRQLLAYAGKEQLTTRSVDVLGLIRDLTGLLRTSIPANVHLTLDLDESLPLVDGDPTQLQQVIMNLVLNAAESIPHARSGTVRVSAAARKPVADDYAHAIVPLPPGENSCVAITITDTGDGMTPEIQSRIFDPFFTTKFTGRGLGLSAVLGIVKAHRGAIALCSARGAGTTMTLLFPVAGISQPVGTTVPAVPLGGRGTVLFVDDEKQVRTLAQRALERYGYQVLLAEDGKQAIEVLGAHSEVTTVVIDLIMPVMTGDQAVPRLRELSPTVPIVLSSGYSELEARKRFAEDGFTSFLQKPYTVTTLLGALTTGSASSTRDGSPFPGVRSQTL